MMQLKRLFLLNLLMAISLPAFSAKLDIYAGAYSFSAKSNDTEGSISGAGSYKLAYYLPLFDQVEAGLGYSLKLADGVSGDAAFGLDVEASYFPLTTAAGIQFQTERSFVRMQPMWKPFVLGGYYSRQFQSVSTQYTGFGLGAGVERALESNFNLKLLVRYITLAGPNKSEATEVDFLAGLNFNF